MAQIEFDETLAARLEKAYSAADIKRRRSIVVDAVAAQPGESILDVGCGPGFYVKDLAEKVGPDGSVVGVDNAPAMLAVAKARAGAKNTRFEEGDATSLPVGDEEFDAALSVQVMEYVPDVPRALGELKRVLKTGGRVVLYDTDFETFSFFTRDPGRMRRVLDAADDHFTHRALPAVLGAELRRAGFEEVRATGVPFVNLDAGPDSYSGALIPIIADFVKARGKVSQDEVDAWAAELSELSEAGDYYFGCLQVMFEGRKP